MSVIITYVCQDYDIIELNSNSQLSEKIGGRVQETTYRSKNKVT